LIGVKNIIDLDIGAGELDGALHLVRCGLCWWGYHFRSGNQTDVLERVGKKCGSGRALCGSPGTVCELEPFFVDLGERDIEFVKGIV